MTSLDNIAKRIAFGHKTAGLIEFKKDQGPLRRDIRIQDFKWDFNSHKDLAKILWAAQRAHSYSTAAHRLFSKLNSSKFSPDGLLGGKGYIQNIKDMRTSLSTVVEFLSTFSDTLYDEVSAPHWRNAGNSPDIEGIMDDTKEIKDNPEGYVQEEYQQEVYENPNAEVMNPAVEDPSKDEQKDEDAEFFQTSSTKLAGGDSSIPVETLPGPRVNRVGPGEGTGWEGSFNPQFDTPSDDPWRRENRSDVTLQPELDLNNPAFPTTDGDSTTFKYKIPRKKRKHAYSWLPGANNDRPLDWYRRDLTEKDLRIMREMADPLYDSKQEYHEKSHINSMLWGHEPVRD